MAETKHVQAPPEGAPEIGADDYPLLRKTCTRYLSPEGMAKVDEAYRFAAQFHRDQKRRSGEPYINHPVEVALILAHDLHMDEDVICAALLHDTVEDTPATLSTSRSSLARRSPSSSTASPSSPRSRSIRWTPSRR